MNALIIYDSLYGNTELVAKAIADGLTPLAETRVIRVGNVSLSDLHGVDLLIVGSPTHRGKPTVAMLEFLDAIPRRALRGVRVAPFDTRNPAKGRGIVIQLLASLGGHAADRIAQKLKRAGGTLAVLPEGFDVAGKEGPLEAGEIERASRWGESLVDTLKAEKTP